MEKWIDFKNNRCKYARIMQALRKSLLIQKNTAKKAVL